MDDGHAPDFKNYAACRDYDPEDWFNYETIRRHPRFHDTEATLRARAICSGCEARVECLAYAVKYENLGGIWGGTDSIQRRAMRKQQGIEPIDFILTMPSLLKTYNGREYATE